MNGTLASRLVINSRGEMNHFADHLVQRCLARQFAADLLALEAP